MKNKLKDIQRYTEKKKTWKKSSLETNKQKHTLKAYSRKIKWLQSGEKTSGLAGFLQLEFISVKQKYQLSRNLLIMFMNT